MKFDQTQIAIRQRSVLELLDLSLLLARIYMGPIASSTMIFVLPLAIANGWLLSWIVADEYSAETVSRYLGCMLLLVFLQMPIATLPTTALLGRVMFVQDFGRRAILADLSRVLPGILWTQGFTRGGWLLILLMLRLQPSLELSSAEGWLLGLGTYSLLLRMTRPFINEIVLLERNPIRAPSRSRITIGRRSRALHNPNLADLVGRWIIAAVATSVLTISLTLTLWFAAGLVSYDWSWGPLVVQIIVPFSFWVGATYATIARFMNYIDLRIRCEGWEVELKVRAAAQELHSNSQLEGQAV